MAFLNATWSVVILSAPWLLLGFLFAGCLHILLPNSLVEKHLQSNGFRSVIKAAIIGTPLPICSCGVIPLAVALRRKGASKGATTSFMISTPEIGVDSFTLSWFILGPTMALARLFTAIISAISVGYAVEKIEASDSLKIHPTTASNKTPCCCANNNPNCVADSAAASVPPMGSSWSSRSLSVISNILYYGFVVMVKDLARLLVMGLLCAGLISALIPDNFFSELQLNRHVAIFSMLLLSIPTYVCSSASTPIAAILLLKGMDPGAALVFLLGGPATNIATMIAIKTELGSKALFVYILGIFFVSLVAGYVLSYGFSNGTWNIVPPHHVHDETVISQVWAVVLCILLIWGMGQGFFSKKGSSHG